MMRVQAEVLGYLLNCLWQVPVIAAVAALIAMLAGRVSPVRAAAVRHRVWVGALIAEVVLPGCSFSLRGLLRGADAGAVGDAQVLMTGGARAGLQVPHWVLGMVAGLYVATIIFFAVRLVYGLVKTHRLVMSAEV